MKIDTKYGARAMDRIASKQSGLLALLIDQILYDGCVESDGYFRVRGKAYVGSKADRSGKCAVLDAEGKPTGYVDVEQVLREARDELFAVAFGQL